MQLHSIHTIAAALMALAAVASSCDRHHSGYTAEYAVFDSVPFNVETNTDATTTMVKTFPGSYMFRSDYPQFNAVVRFGIVDIPDSSKIRKAIANHFDRMSDRIGVYESEIRDVVNDAGMHGWIMVTPECPAPVQMMVTDSATMILHATMEFTSPQTDTARVVIPAAEAIAADLEHIIINLQPK